MPLELQTSASILDYPGYYEGVDFSQRNENDFFEYTLPHFKKWEKPIPNLYLDEKGNVTVGIGHLVPSAKANALLNYDSFFVSPTPPRPVGQNDKIESWEKINEFYKELKGKKPFPLGGNNIFREKSNLNMPETYMITLFYEDLKERIRALKKIFPNFDKYPDPAKLGIVDVFFNVGYGNFSKFAKFKTAVFKQNWLLAGNESTRPEVKGRNNDVYALFREAHLKQTEKNVPANALEKMMHSEELKTILESEKGYDANW